MGKWKKGNTSKMRKRTTSKISRGKPMADHLQTQMPEEMEKAIKNIKEFLESRKLEFNMSQSTLEKYRSIRVDFDLTKPNRVLEEEFNKFINSLKELGFHHDNEGKNVILKCDPCKKYLMYDVYRHSKENDLVIVLKYAKDESDRKIVINLDKIVIDKDIIYTW